MNRVARSNWRVSASRCFGQSESTADSRNLRCDSIVRFAAAEHLPALDQALSIGVALQTAFAISCQGFSDPDGDVPLQFAFSFVLGGTSECQHSRCSLNKVLTDIIAQPESLSMQAGGLILPAGNVTLMVQVIDTAGAVATQSLWVLVSGMLWRLHEFI